jgi:hypothetical protein
LVLLFAGCSGSSAPSITGTPPDAPTGVAAVPGNSLAVVSWAAPNDNGMSITGYTITSSPGGISAGVSGGTVAAITGLTNNVTYTFTVTATSSAGTSAPSSPSNAVTPSSNPGTPSAPLNVSAVPDNALGSRATVSWQAPASPGATPVTGYVITPNPTGAAVIAGVSETSKVIAGLTGGINHTFTVVATNQEGAGAAGTSTPVAIVGPAQPPTGVLVNSGVACTGTNCDQRATISFTAPANSGGVPIVNYTVTAAPGGATASGAGSPILINGLTNGTPYTYTVTANNAYGASVASTATSPAVAPFGVPPAPTIGIPDRGNLQAIVNWSQSNNGDAIVQNWINIYTSDVSCTTAVLATTDSTPTCSTAGCAVVASPLTNDTVVYRFGVFTRNAAGWSAMSALSDCVIPSATPTTLPTAVLNLTATASTTVASTVAVDWDAPLDAGENPISLYRVQAWSGNVLVRDVTTAATARTFTDLHTCVYDSGAGVLRNYATNASTTSCNQSYRFYVWAYNGSSADADNGAGSESGNGGPFFAPDAGYGTRSGGVSATPRTGYSNANVPGVFSWIGCESCHTAALGNPLDLDAALSVNQRHCNASYGTCSGVGCSTCTIGALASRQRIYECPSGNGCSVPAMGTPIAVSGPEDLLFRAWVTDGNLR